MINNLTDKRGWEQNIKEIANTVVWKVFIHIKNQ
jgi:hypothetical protein